MADGCTEIVQVNFASVPSERVVVPPVTNPFVEDRVVLDGYPPGVGRIYLPTLQQLAFLNLKMNHAVLLVKANSGDNPAGVFVFHKF